MAEWMPIDKSPPVEAHEIAGDIPVLPLRNMVLFPDVILPITVSRKRSIALSRKVYKEGKILAVLAQKRTKIETPSPKDLHSVGTLARIIKFIKLPDNNISIIIHGKKRFALQDWTHEEPYLMGKVQALEDTEGDAKLSKQSRRHFMRAMKEAAIRIIDLHTDISKEARTALGHIETFSFLVHFLCSNIPIPITEKQKCLENSNLLRRADLLLLAMEKHIKMLEIKHEVQDKAYSDIDRQQRNYLLRQQLKILQNELGAEEGENEYKALEKKAQQKKWGKEIQEHFEKELDRLRRTIPATPEYVVALNYVEFLVNLPWHAYATQAVDLHKSQKVLDKNHYGIHKIKERVIEHLAVMKLKQDTRAPILCLCGPPGVGKTSLARTIAKALGRKYVRCSLGGVHDEAEIRGHRRTYIGAMPGKIMSNINKAGVSNPVFSLDEIDKIGTHFRGDPSSALLEVLDPEQNNHFVDNYLEVGYDLSHVFFIATANTMDTIHPALLDRMEVIEMSGYTMEEKLHIAKRHLIPAVRAAHGLKATDVRLTDGAIKKIIRFYAREAGVRELNRKIGAIMRKIARVVAGRLDETQKIRKKQKHQETKEAQEANKEISYNKTIHEDDVRRLLGVEVYESESYERQGLAGVAIGLAWTQVGGEILYIEASLYRGKGKITFSGQLGDVMRESAMASFSYLRAQADTLSIDHEIFNHYDLHVHLPAGAVPKDGPSAGITLLTAMASVYLQCQVKPRVAMTGEITLSGRVLAVGGIKEKLLAARMGGLKEVILCELNRKDVEELEPEYLRGLNLHYVRMADEVLAHALLKKPVKHARVLWPLELASHVNGNPKKDKEHA